MAQVKAQPKVETRGRNQRTYFDGKELRDATADMQIPVLPTDLAAAEAVRSGKVNDVERFKQCLVAQACNRVFGEDAHVAIMRRTAYVSLPGEKHAVRYMVPADTYELVSAFDQKKPVELGTMIKLTVPPKGESLSHKRKYKKNWRQANPAHASGNQPRKTKIKNKKMDPLVGVVRNGAYVRF